MFCFRVFIFASTEHARVYHIIIEIFLSMFPFQMFIFKRALYYHWDLLFPRKPVPHSSTPYISTQLRFNVRPKRTDSYLMAQLGVSEENRERCTRG